MGVKAENFVDNESKFTEAFVTKIVSALERAHVFELFLIIHGILWGGWLLFGEDNYKANLNNPFNAIVSDHAWAYGSIFLGLFLATTIAFEFGRAKKVALFLSAIWWTFVCIAFAKMGISGTGGVATHMSIAIAAGLSYSKNELRNAEKGKKSDGDGK